MGILFAIIAFLQASQESAGLDPQQSTLLFLQKLSAVEHTFFPIAVVFLVIGVVLVLLAPRKRQEMGLLRCAGGCLMPVAFAVAIGSILPMIFTGWALGSLNQETGAIVNSLGFWGAVALYVITSWT